MAEDVKSVENKAWYLTNISRVLDSLPGSNILKTHYLSKNAELFFERDPEKIQSDVKKRCSRCFIQYDDQMASYRIQSERKRSKFVQKLLKKSKYNKMLTRFQTVYLKTLQRKMHPNAHNTMIITCNVCKNETKIKLSKPIQQKKKMNVENGSIVVIHSGKKRKKKKDKFSGLNKEVVLSSTPQQNTNLNRRDIIPNNLASPINTSTPNIPTRTNHIGVKKDLFPRQPNLPSCSRYDGSVIQMAGPSKNKSRREKKKKLKGIRKMLNNSNKKSQNTSLKQFLQSI